MFFLFMRTEYIFLFMFPPASYVEGLSLTTTSLRYQDSRLEIS
jgi:hypothetical protein